MTESKGSGENSTPPQRRAPTRNLGTRLAIAGGGMLIGLLLLLRLFAFEPFSIPSGSMEPTLRVGDYIAVGTYAYGWSRYSGLVGLIVPQGRIFYRPPQRGDVVVFRTPGNPRETFIKRVIGLPGDKVQLKGGVVYINDVAVSRARGDDYAEAERGIPPVIREQYRETLPGGPSYQVVLEPRQGTVPGPGCNEAKKYTGDPENTCPFLVPPDHFFMLGDNRDNSADSRIQGGIVGMVPAENLIGRVALVLFSTEDFGRTFTRIR